MRRAAARCFAGGRARPEGGGAAEGRAAVRGGRLWRLREALGGLGVPPSSGLRLTVVCGAARRWAASASSSVRGPQGEGEAEGEGGGGGGGGGAAGGSGRGARSTAAARVEARSLAREVDTRQLILRQQLRMAANGKVADESDSPPGYWQEEEGEGRARKEGKETQPSSDSASRGYS